MKQTQIGVRNRGKLTQGSGTGGLDSEQRPSNEGGRWYEQAMPYLKEQPLPFLSQDLMVIGTEDIGGTLGMKEANPRKRMDCNRECSPKSYGAPQNRVA